MTARLRYAAGFLVAVTLSGSVRLSVAQQTARRTVIDNERGFYFTFPYHLDWSGIGADVMLPRRDFFARMRPDAIKMPHGHLQHFAPADPQDRFPFQELFDYDSDEVDHGRPSLFVTATYQGKKRSVYFAWDLEPDKAGKPTTDPSLWQRAVNLRDARFLRFFIHQYVRGQQWQPKLQNMWHSVDQCSFRYQLYGVLDANGTFVANLPWDPPYAQNDDEFLQSVTYFLKRLKALAPDIRVVGNEGSLNDERRFPQVWADMAGTIREDICFGFEGSDYARHGLYTAYKRYAWLGSTGKMTICRLLLPPRTRADYAERLRTGYLTYLIFRGPDAFFGPRIEDGRVGEAPPDDYADLKSRIGLPIAPATSAQDTTQTGDGYRFYARRCEGGLVYLNWTGHTRIVDLPVGRNYYDRNGHSITRLTIPDRTGDVALTAPGPRVARPSINPRYAGVVSGTVRVRIDDSTRGARVRYTTDGSEPSAHSSLYTQPILLSHDATVRVRAFQPGRLPSFTASATYTITSEPPAVEFHLIADSGSRSLRHNYPLVALSHPSAETVQVAYRLVGEGSALASGPLSPLTTGKLTFPPGETYAYFPLTFSNDPGKAASTRVRFRLYHPVHARLGRKTLYTYQIENE
ncbi:MAG TPA: chitobiase/beta-hexosaminidase C-terminal domain-containing protein [Chthonomonadaceae bacterium]|nr:chitobiase/beta-hexosaminidase C-terminal domain-containing protein [Chthonomonadaceae bacterium]